MLRSSAHLAFLGACLCAAVVVLGACETVPDDELVQPTVTRTVPPTPPADLPGLPTGDAGIAPDDVVWAQGSALHVGPRTVDLAPLRIESFVVVVGGVFFVSDSELWFTDLQRARATPFKAVGDLAVSRDGGRLAFIDLGHGPQDAEGTRLAAVMAYDTRTGASLLASYDGMGDPLEDDLEDRYRASAPRVLGFDDGDLLVQGLEGAQLHDLPEGGAAPGGGAAPPAVPVEGEVELDLPEGAIGPGLGLRGYPADFSEGRWLDEDRVAGLGTYDGVRAVVTCDLARRACTRSPARLEAGPVLFGDGRPAG